MISTPKISVLMPLYDAKEFLAEAIESILNQTFQDFEFIIVDDSSDGSYDIAKKYAEQDARIKLIKNNPPLGLRKSSNIGIKEAKGKYIVRMEADDISLPERLERQYEFMESNPNVDVSGCYLQLFGRDKSKWKYYINDDEIKAGMMWGITIAHPTTFMKRDILINKKLFYREEGFPYSEDREFFYDMRNHVTFKNLPEFLYLYRRSAGSVTQRMKSKKNELINKFIGEVFTDFGIEFIEEDLYSHQFILGEFINGVNKENLLKAKSWYDKLLNHNKTNRIFNHNVFSRICSDKWKRLFFLLMNRDEKLALTYFKISDRIYPSQVLYYLKLKWNNMIKKKINQVKL